ncbi:adenylate/guanylate cyclase domain-containing protein [Desertifilum sp. FACHB-1129]|uniref:Adenylate cyclase n=1 Tax=Desertifilum tharense IPPAS B-1220 TaxID=1781255 RepID=A0A1E5QHY2_9CYAN|nr:MULTISPECIES: adenylate/guanylate cyclase domain-containing protein [Desertifilum]MDA0211917.1 adenylate/guanylate cyclase domain-containing protein [Cyanobacteria bacterium FC1]MBD2314016.1 adenylate/guanylate cyclase domain-containing protein [Desertifilum sp. FACHB-1129]MBD2320342.1 adenylate/guanylate cyclase domain-containing protein [Desertifilum sp. FACHB-866]MBD2330470.1 adenylate/guanylate cyclase domain-containing protein [Desertifilum sp. FACHB-868]OEJ74221.1 adenylate cyclase [D
MPKDKKRSFGPTPNHPPRRLHRYPALLSRLAQWSSLISESFHSDLRALAIAALSSSILLLGIRHLGWLQPLELSAYDQIIRLRSPDPPDPRILIVTITEQDIQAYNRWPLSDGHIAQLLQKLQAMQPRVIGLDLYRDVRYEPGHEELRAALQAENVIAITKLPDPETIGVPAPPGVPPERVGFNDLLLDPDGITRRSLLYGTLKGKPILSFSLLAATSYLKHEGITLSTTPDYQIQLGETIFHRLESNSGGYQTLDAQGYQTLIHYRSGQAVAHQVSLTQVLYGRMQTQWVKDKVVLIGTTAPSGKDLFNTPYSFAAQDNPKMPGVIVHAQILSQILSATLDDRPLHGWWDEKMDVAWILLWSGVGMAIGWGSRHPLGQAIGILTALGVIILTGVGLGMGSFPGANQPLWIPIGAPILAVGLTSSTVLVARGYAASRQQKVVMKLLGQNTSPEVAQALWKSRDHLIKSGTLPGQKLTATMLFADIKDFSTISEQMPPEKLLIWLNELLSVMTTEVMQHHGIVNKFTGDGIMAVFGVPFARTTEAEIARDAQRAVACALTIGEALQQLNETWQKCHLPLVNLRVGIFTGPIVAGSLGGKDRLEYGVIGDSVNTASRLESCEKHRQPSSCRILIAQETLNYLNHQFVVEAWGSFALKGKQQMVEVYRVIGLSERATLNSSRSSDDIKIDGDPEQPSNSLSLS